ncbi:MAG: DNA polymerase III subunit epsilon, partial [Gammaproteobacteria bacterium]|nr:DNA polymerase III subunit epsilon [Gammaproteobacteria bacterium]
LKDAEVIIHNADFDVGFLDFELAQIEKETGKKLGRIADHCKVTDTLRLARQIHPGQRNSLDALCKRYHVDNTARTVHGALLDADLLTDVYLAMTGGQVSLTLEVNQQQSQAATQRKQVNFSQMQLKVISASDEELTAHQNMLDHICASSADQCVWQQLEKQ